MADYQRFARWPLWEILVLAVFFQQSGAVSNDATAPFVSDEFAVSPEEVAKAMRKVALRQVLISADWSLGQYSDKTVRGTYSVPAVHR